MNVVFNPYDLLPLKDTLDAMDLSELGWKVIQTQYRDYFLDPAGQDHYRLLAHISTLYSNQTVLDIGTYKGCSALALSYNKKTTVFTFDIGSFWELSEVPTNVVRVIDDVTNDKYTDLIRTTSFILLDTAHDGIFERKLHTLLQRLEWKGVLMLDDIALNDEMREYWASITEPKVNMSPVGHWSGTGMVVFD